MRRYSREEILAAFPPLLDVSSDKEGNNPSGHFDHDEAIAAIVDYQEGRHDALRGLAMAAMTNGGMRKHLGALMRSVPKTQRNGTWSARFAEIPALVDSAFNHEPEVGEPGAPLELHTAADLAAKAAAPQWLVKPLIEQGQHGVMFGADGTYKSFFAIDMALHVAAGRPWHGLPVKQGPVLFLAGEGGGGMPRRLAAAQMKTGITDAPLVCSMIPTSFVDPGALALVRKRLAEIEQKFGTPPVLVILDTLSTFFGAGDENAAKDMGAFISVIRAIARDGPAVMCVHHTGHSEDRERGHSRLIRDAEFRFSVTWQGPLIAKVASRKLKEATLEEGGFLLRLEMVDLGLLDDQGDPVTSLAVTGRTMAQTFSTVARQPTEKQRLCVEVLTEMLKLIPDGEHQRVSRFDFTQTLIAAEFTSRRNAPRDIKAMAKKGLIVLSENEDDVALVVEDSVEDNK